MKVDTFLGVQYLKNLKHCHSYKHCWDFRILCLMFPQLLQLPRVLVDFVPVNDTSYLKVELKFIQNGLADFNYFLLYKRHITCDLLFNILYTPYNIPRTLKTIKR